MNEITEGDVYAKAILFAVECAVVGSILNFFLG